MFLAGATIERTDLLALSSWCATISDGLFTVLADE
jgi:hypothetical protein